MARYRNNRCCSSGRSGRYHSRAQEAVGVHTLHGSTRGSCSWAHNNRRADRQAVVPGIHPFYGRYMGGPDCGFRKEKESRMSSFFRPLILCLAALSLALPGCAVYHMQAPRTTPEGEWDFGGSIGGVGSFSTDSTGKLEFGAIPLAGFGARYGIGKRFDVGISSWGVGAKLDCKYGIIPDYLAVGAGAGIGTLFSIAEFPFFYVGEGSLYLGYPFKKVYPYLSGRVWLLGLGTYAVNPMLAAMAGLKIPLFRRTSIFLETGVLNAYYHDSGPWQNDLMLNANIGFFFNK